MKTNNFLKKEFPALILLLIPFVMIGIYWNDFPPQIPMHWNFAGEIDRYVQKEIGLFLIPALNIFFYVMFFILPKVDPRRENYQVFSSSYQVLRFSINGFLFFLFIVIFLASLRHDLNVGMFVINLTLVLILILGNFMGKFKSNSFVGIKTPWTLGNEDNWNKTHRLAGRLWVGLSLLMIVLTLILPMNVLTILYFVYVGIIGIIPVVYSYMLHVNMGKGRREKGKGEKVKRRRGDN